MNLGHSLQAYKKSYFFLLFPTFFASSYFFPTFIQKIPTIPTFMP